MLNRHVRDANGLTEDGRCDLTAYYQKGFTKLDNGMQIPLCFYCNVECSELGCSGPSASNCNQCKNLQFYSTCVTECPFGYKAEDPNKDNRCYMANSIMVAILTACILLTWFVISCLSRWYYRKKTQRHLSKRSHPSDRRDHFSGDGGETQAFLEGYLMSSTADAPYMPVNKSRGADFSPESRLKFQQVNGNDGGIKRMSGVSGGHSEKYGSGTLPSYSPVHRVGMDLYGVASSSDTSNDGVTMEPHLVSSSYPTTPAVSQPSSPVAQQNFYDLNYMQDGKGETKMGVVFMKSA